MHVGEYKYSFPIAELHSLQKSSLHYSSAAIPKTSFKKLRKRSASVRRGFRHRCINVFLILVTFFTFLTFFYFPNVFYLKNVGKVQSGKTNKKHFENNSNEIDL